MRAESWFETVVPANWKLVAEAFMEGYHAEQTHPQLLARSAKSGYSPGTDPLGFVDPEDIAGSSLYFMRTLSEGMGGGMVHARDIEVAEGIVGMDLPADPMEALTAWTTRLNEEIRARANAEGAGDCRSPGAAPHPSPGRRGGAGSVLWASRRRPR